MQPLGKRLQQVLQNYSNTPVLHQMLTRQGAACMAQQCPHEQPKETMEEPMTDTAACWPRRVLMHAMYPQVGKKESMSTHDGNGQDSSDII